MTKELKISRLIDSNCYEEWRDNVRIMCIKCGADLLERLHDLLDTDESFENFIARSFAWLATPEDGGYWGSVATESLPIDPLPIYSKP